MTLSGREWTITAGAHAASVVEVGAGLRRYRVGDRDVTCTYGDDVLPPKGCGTSLVPWPNRLAGGRYTFDGEQQQVALTEPDAGNAIHGLGRWARWAPTRQDEHLVTLGLDVVPQKGYPFEVRVEVTYEVHAERGLTVTLAAVNHGARRAPFGAGSHPYLSSGGTRLDDVALTLPVADVLVTDDHQVPVGRRAVDADTDFRAGPRLGKRRFDTGFTTVTDRDADGRARAEVRTANGGAQLWFDAAFGFLQVFTVDDVTPGQHGIAIEPMSCAPNAFNSGDGLVVLEPGDTWTGSWGIRPL